MYAKWTNQDLDNQERFEDVEEVSAIYGLKYTIEKRVIFTSDRALLKNLAL